MTHDDQHDTLDAAVAAEFAAYRPVARALFPAPSTDTVVVQARTRQLRRRFATMALAAATVMVVATAVTVPVWFVRGDRDRVLSPAVSSSAGTPTTSSPTPDPMSSPPDGGTPSGPVLVELVPPRVAPGGTIDIVAECGFPPAPAVVDSTAFAQTSLTRYEAGRMGGTATVRPGTRAGNHVVNVHCADGRTGQASVTVTTGP